MELCSYTLVITFLILLIISFVIYLFKKDMICTCANNTQNHVDYFTNSSNDTVNDINSIKGKDWLDVISWKSRRSPITIDQSYRWYNTQ